MKKTIKFTVLSLVLFVIVLLYPFITLGATEGTEGEEKTVVFTIDQKTYTIGSKEVKVDAAPYIKDGRTMVPVAFVAPALGTEAPQWNSQDRTVLITKGDRRVLITIGSKELVVNGKKLLMDVAAEIKNTTNGGGRTMLPIAFIARALEVGYQWDGVTRSVAFFGFSKIYDQEGTYGPDSGNNTIEGSVVVKAQGVTLRNMVIKGNLTIAEEVGQGDVTLNNVIVNGTAYIRGGGKDSIHINGGQYKNITIQDVNGIVRVVAKDVNNLPVVISEDAKGEEIILEGNFTSVRVEAQGANVTIQGEIVIQEIIVEASATQTRLNINNGAIVEKMVLDSKTEVKGTGTIKIAEVNTDGVTFEKAPEQQTVIEKEKTPPTISGDDNIIPVSSITVTTADQALAVGATLQVTTTLLPTDATIKQVVWTSDEPSVATVSATGRITGLNPGIATITVTTVDGRKTDNVVINVLPVMGGTVDITGVLKYGEVLTANIANITYTSATAADEPTYRWYRNESAIEGAAAEIYTLTAADLGQTITVIVTADGIHALGSVTSAPTGVIVKADAAAPAAPVLDSKTATSITLVADAAYEYTIDNGASWQASNEFTGLNALTEYTFKARLKETATHYASAASEGTGITTSPPVMSGTVTITGTLKYGQVLMANPLLTYTPTTATDVPTYQWKRNGSVISGATNPTYTLTAADVGQTITVTINADGVHATGSVTSAPTGTIDKADGPAAPSAPTLSSKTATSITLVANAAYEYTIDNGTSWQSGNVFNGLNALTAYTFKARIKETATHKASAASAGNSITTSPPVMNGTVSITGTLKYGQVLTAIYILMYTPTTLADVPTYQWKRNGSVISGATNPTYTLTAADVGQTITVTVSADGTHATGSVTSAPTGTIDKADGPAAPSAPTLSSKTATSITLVANAAYEYTIDNGASWQSGNEFTGLNPLTAYTFKARLKETTTHYASAASVGNSITTSPPVMSGTVTITGTLKYGQVLTANPLLTYTPTTATDVPTYQWKRGGISIGGATGTTYTLAAGDVGQAITVTVTADGVNATGSVTSAPTAAINKADGPEAPAAPELADKTHNTVTLVANELHQFSKNGGATWQDSEFFDNLSPATEYSFSARNKATATHNDSAASTAIAVTTNPSPPVFVSAEINGAGTKILITFNKDLAEPPAAPAGFTVNLAGTDNPVTEVVRNSGNYSVYELTITTAVHYGQMVTVAYTPGSLTALDGGIMESFSAQDVTTTTRTYALGDIGPAGGYIFYNEGTGDWKYLEAAPASTEISARWWGKSGTWVGTGTGVGTGKTNTPKIVAVMKAAPELTDTPAQMCDNLSVSNNGTTYDDWFMPSKDELNLLYQRLHAPDTRVADGGFNGFYWSSSEAADIWAHWQIFYDGMQAVSNKMSNNNTRAIRSF